VVCDSTDDRIEFSERSEYKIWPIAGCTDQCDSAVNQHFKIGGAVGHHDFLVANLFFAAHRTVSVDWCTGGGRPTDVRGRPLAGGVERSHQEFSDFLDAGMTDEGQLA